MTNIIYFVDAFADRPFCGNPAAVCVLNSPADESWMKLVARELNLSETAYLWPEGVGYRLRWFTPRVEVDLCGHATLAASHILWETGLLGGDRPAIFHTRSGTLKASYSENMITLDFPATPVTGPLDTAELAIALGTPIASAWETAFDILVEVEGEECLRALTPDMRRLALFPTRGVIVTCRASRPPFDFVSRFFAPASGIDEDPVTGSAHCALGPYWRERVGRDTMVGYQASTRGGAVILTIQGDRILLGGKAVTMLRGELFA